MYVLCMYGGMQVSMCQHCSMRWCNHWQICSLHTNKQRTWGSRVSTPFCCSHGAASLAVTMLQLASTFGVCRGSPTPSNLYTRICHSHGWRSGCRDVQTCFQVRVVYVWVRVPEFVRVCVLVSTLVIVCVRVCMCVGVWCACVYVRIIVYLMGVYS